MPAPTVDRRGFLAAGGAALASCAGAARADDAGADDAGADDALPVIDTHVHFYDPRRPQGVPWPPPGDVLLHRPTLPADYRAALGADASQRREVIVVEASPWVDDNDWLLELAAGEPLIRGIVGRLPIGAVKCRDYLARLVQHPVFRGVRIGGSEVQAALTQPATLADLQRLADAGRTLDVNLPATQLPRIAELAARLPTLTIVINHVGGQRIDGGPPPDDWRHAMAACAQHERVYCKVSGLVEHARREGGAPESLDHYRPLLDFLWTTFGDRRLLFGTNWPVCGKAAPLALVERLPREYLATHDHQAARRLLYDNAVRAYALGP